MTEQNASDRQVTHFVRHTLGCGCPDEVFELIRIDHLPEIFSGLPVDYMIDIGGRLLVVVCAMARWRDVLQSLEAIVAAGRAHRDRSGFNRFRLVVAAQDTHEAQTALSTVFEAAVDGDEKMHLHVLKPAALPGAPLLQ